MANYSISIVLLLQFREDSIVEITDVKVRKILKEGKLRAVVSLTFDHSFAVHDIKVIEGQNGPLVVMPSRKTLEGEYRDVAHPINSEFREKITAVIMEAYHAL
jgi:stage V sporulation protein G